MNGSDIGIVITLNNAVTELGVANTVSTIIAKRHNGYFISRLDDDINISINGDPISGETQLAENMKISIENKNYLFFLE
jgi:hypothetical protein